MLDKPFKKELQQDGHHSEIEPARGRAMSHSSVIKINSTRVEDTGSYFCYEDGELKNSTHIFVQGTSNKKAPIRDHDDK
jgi:hypothetical protein